MFKEVENYTPNFGYVQQFWSNVSPWGDILLFMVTAVTLAALIGATVWGVKHSG